MTLGSSAEESRGRRFGKARGRKVRGRGCVPGGFGVVDGRLDDRGLDGMVAEG